MNEKFVNPCAFWNSRMTVNDYKETACATAGAVEEDMEVESEPTLQAPVAQDSENLLGRVLAGKKSKSTLMRFSTWL